MIECDDCDGRGTVSVPLRCECCYDTEICIVCEGAGEIENEEDK